MIDKKKRLRSKCDRAWFEKLIKQNPLCEICFDKAVQVHHYYPKGLYGHLRYDLDNGISLCMKCHFFHHHRGDPSIMEAVLKSRGKRWLNRLSKKAKNRPQGSYLTISWYEQKLKELKSLSSL